MSNTGLPSLSPDTLLEAVRCSLFLFVSRKHVDKLKTALRRFFCSARYAVIHSPLSLASVIYIRITFDKNDEIYLRLIVLSDYALGSPSTQQVPPVLWHPFYVNVSIDT